MFRGYLISGLLVLALFATAQYRGWSLFGASEAKSPPGTTRGIYHK
ncbi:MAG: hypothetical protein RKO25_14540 [Candidatus Contendobacter sp.]|nr:hypothetical protein [Candidatus Contendobacter sp.]